MDYSVRDSSIIQDPDVFRVYDENDTSIRVGIVREEREIADGTTRYIVEVAYKSKQIPVSCVLVTKFGGAHNYEEYRIRPWARKFPTGLLSPSSASTYDLRSGDVVVVAFLDGQSREGVILGGLKHAAREEKTKQGNIEYISEFNGIEKQIRKDGSYKVSFKGKPINDALLDVPPAGQPVPAPQYNPLITGSFYGFDSDGSYIVSDGGKQYIKISKSLTSGSLVIVSGKNRIDLGGNPALGKMGLKTDNFAVEALKSSIKSKVSMNVETLQMSLKATQMAIGSDQFELFDGLVKLIDALGTLVVTSPVGTCTPLMASPTWAAQVLPLKVMIQTMVTGVKAADSVETSDEGNTKLDSDVGS